MAEQRVNRYREEMDAKRILQIRDIARELPQSCGDFLRSIAISTSTLTRLAYAIDLNTFFTFLHNERIHFSEKPLRLMDDSDLEKLDRTDIVAYTEYLTYYFKNTDDASVPNKVYVNHELSIKRKLCSIRSFYDYLFKNQRISSNVTELVPLPKIHEKPIIRLSKDEMSRMLELAQSGDQLTEHQQKFQKITARRDFAILSLFLGTAAMWIWKTTPLLLPGKAAIRWFCTSPLKWLKPWRIICRNVLVWKRWKVMKTLCFSVCSAKESRSALFRIW